MNELETRGDVGSLSSCTMVVATVPPSRSFLFPLIIASLPLPGSPTLLSDGSSDLLLAKPTLTTLNKIKTYCYSIFSFFFVCVTREDVLFDYFRWYSETSRCGAPLIAAVVHVCTTGSSAALCTETGLSYILPPLTIERMKASSMLRPQWDGAPGLGKRTKFRATLQNWNLKVLKGLQQLPPPAGDAAAPSHRHYYQRIQQMIAAKSASYAESVPFSERWNSIFGSLKILGNVSQGNKVTVYKDSGDAFKAMWSAVEGAKKEALWQTYICKDDFVGKKTVARLLHAQRRHCYTELLYDAGGNISGRSKLTDQLKREGATVLVYRPFFSHLWRYLLTFDWRISPGLRNHRKILLVDDEIGFCGGLNVGNEYCSAHAGGSGRFRDTHCSVVGPAIQHLRKVYEDTKQPQPSRFSWARWRQRASRQWDWTYRSGSNAIVTRIVKPLKRRTASARTRGRQYFRRQLRRAQLQTTRMIERVDWRGATRKSQREEPPASGRAAAPASAPADGLRAGTLRKVRKDRPKLFMAAATERGATKALLKTPLKDTDPVPEAALYAKKFEPTTQILQSNPSYGDYTIQYAFWQVVRKCHRRVWVTTPYYLPSAKHLRAMIHAASRGVDVRILTGSQTTTDPWFMWYASTYITGMLLKAGVRVFEYKGNGVMHAKTMVVDSLWSSVGSFNWDPMSNMNLEVCLCHLDTGMARVMEQHFLEDLACSEEVHLSAHHQRPLWVRFASWILHKMVFVLLRITFSTLSVPDLEYSYNSRGTDNSKAQKSKINICFPYGDLRSFVIRIFPAALRFLGFAAFQALTYFRPIELYRRPAFLFVSSCMLHTSRQLLLLAATGIVRAPPREGDTLGAPVDSHHFLATSGTSYYFPKDRHSEKPAPPDDATAVFIRGVGRHFSVSTAVPPLTPEEVERWKLDRLIVTRPLQFDVDREPKFLLPPKERIYSLGPEMDKIDELYRRKGRYTPSEVAHAFFHVVPSFFVELRHVWQALPPALTYRMEQDLGPRGLGANFFSGYPMLFRQRRPTHQKSAVKLNSDFWFVQAHPFYKRADRLQYKNNSDYKAHIGGVVHKHAPSGTGVASLSSKDIDLKVFDILARHVMKGSGTGSEAKDGAEGAVGDPYAATPLIQWMNSLNREDMATIQQVPEKRVIHILSKYVRVFQLLCAHAEDPLLYTDRENLNVDLTEVESDAAEPEERTPATASDAETAACEGDTPDAGPSEDDDPFDDLEDSAAGPEPIMNAAPASGAGKESAGSGSGPAVLHQLDDDLLGLEDILSGESTSAPPEPPGRHPSAATSGPVTGEGDIPAPPGPVAGEGDIPARLDILLVRRLPPFLAPRSLSNFNATHTPLPEITLLAASFLGPPPSLRKTLANFFSKARMRHGRHTASLEGEVWRWVPIRLLYDALSKEQKRELRPYRGLTNYLRLHGELFEVSTDLMHVIAHDPNGVVSPFLPQQKTFAFEERVVLPERAEAGGGATMVGERERKLFADILGESQIPTTRKQIALLDPENPILQHEIFYEEIARLLPPHPVRKREVLQRLPPILRAAVPVRGLFLNNCSKHIAVFFEAGETMVQRKDLADPARIAGSKPGDPPAMSADAAIEEVRQNMPEGGATVKALRKMYIPSAAVGALIQHFGSIIRGLEAFPHYFVVERREGMPASDSFYVRLCHSQVHRRSSTAGFLLEESLTNWYGATLTWKLLSFAVVRCFIICRPLYPLYTSIAAAPPPEQMPPKLKALPKKVAAPPHPPKDEAQELTIGNIRVGPSGVEFTGDGDLHVMRPELKIESLRKVKNIGQGVQGNVSMYVTPDSQKYAVKKIPISSMCDDRMRQTVAAELRNIFTQASNEYTVDLYNAYYRDGCLRMVMEYMDWGNLQEFFDMQPKIPENIGAFIADQPEQDAAKGFMALLVEVTVTESVSIRKESKCSPEAEDFVNRCLRQKPEERSTAKELLEHPWIKKNEASGSEALVALLASLKNTARNED
eukprot:gene7254-5101_t